MLSIRSRAGTFATGIKKRRYIISSALTTVAALVFAVTTIPPHQQPALAVVNDASPTAPSSASDKGSSQAEVTDAANSPETTHATPPSSPIAAPITPQKKAAQQPNKALAHEDNAPPTPVYSPTALKYAVNTYAMKPLPDIYHSASVRIPYTIVRDGTYNGPGGASFCKIQSGPGTTYAFNAVICSPVTTSTDGGYMDVYAQVDAPSGTYTIVMGVDLAFTPFRNTYTIQLNPTGLTP